MTQTNYQYWTPQQEKLLKENYATSSPKEIQQLLKRGPHSIRAKVRLLNLKKQILHTKDEAFFESPTILNCLIAGEIAADGNIREHNKDHKEAVVFNKCEKDLPYLEKIHATLKCTASITKRICVNPANKQETKIAYSFQAGSAAHWVKCLNKHWNIGPRKSLTLKAPNISDKYQILFYYLGYFFGDGSICYTDFRKAEAKDAHMDIVGTYNFCDFFREFFDKLFETNSKVREERENSKISIYRMCKAKIYLLTKIWASFPELEPLFMERKFLKMKQIVSDIESKPLHKYTQAILKKHFTSKIKVIFKERNIKIPTFLT